ncbi:MAG: EAL domain-containing protein [Actinomycetes bacterium]
MQARPSLLRLSRFAVFWWLSVLGGWSLLAVATSVTVPELGSAPVTVWVLAGFVVLGELLPVITAGGYDSQGVPTSHAFAFAVLYMYGPWPAIVLMAVGTLISEIVKRKQLWRLLFNIGQYVLSITAAGVVMVAFGHQASLSTVPATLTASDLVWVVLGWFAFFFTNDALVAGLSGDVGRTWAQDFFEEFWYYFFTTFAVLALSPLVVFVSSVPAYLPLLLLPLFAVRKTASISREKEHQALHDALTGLPNRKLLVNRLDAALAANSGDGTSVGLCLLDLDRFKEVNDTLGHHVGDRLLELAAQRIQGALRPDDVVARLGGDEFAILLNPVRDVAAAVEVAERVRGSLTEAFHLEGLQLELEASVGVAVFPEHGGDSEHLMRRADVAMYLAKEERTGVEAYVADRDHNSASRLALLGGLRTALESGELELHYQPKVAMGAGAVVGVEALVRWRHPTRGMVMPDDFIPLAEHSGLMGPLTSFVLDSALGQAATWRETGLDIQVAVNVSMRDLHDPQLPGTVAALLERYDLPSSALQLELTERVLTRDADGVAATLRALRRLGVEISLDDFGTGYSSMVLLKQLPVNEIKIDRSFVSRLGVDPEDATIVRSIIDLAHGMGMRAVAEGVETQPVWDLLEDLGCDAVQGWYVSRALDVEAATSWLLRHPAHRNRLRVVAGESNTA